MRVSVRWIALIALAALTGCISSNQSLFEELSNAVKPPVGTHTGITGTAFFISDDGILLTAEHVVHRCLQINILSERVGPTAASVIATYDDLDLALLRVGSQVSVPSTLRIDDVAPSPSETLRVYGYPRSADLRRPSTIDAKLVNDRFVAKAKGAFADPRWLVLLDGPVEHGYSGGPVIDHNGAVVGVMHGGGHKDPELSRFFVAMGSKGVAVLTRNIDFQPPTARARLLAGDDDSSVRSAIVRVVCWSEN